jgi:hypothetical protein
MRPRGAVLVASSIEMCDGTVKSCVACDEPIRMTWHDKIKTI